MDPNHLRNLADLFSTCPYVVGPDSTGVYADLIGSAVEVVTAADAGRLLQVRLVGHGETLRTDTANYRYTVTEEGVVTVADSGFGRNQHIQYVPADHSTPEQLAKTRSDARRIISTYGATTVDPDRPL